VSESVCISLAVFVYESSLKQKAGFAFFKDTICQQKMAGCKPAIFEK
jgi:hypothetical protein